MSNEAACRIQKSHGFTLIELMISLAIFGILMAIAIPNFFSYIEKARIAQAIAEIKMLEKEILNYQITNDSLPDTMNDIAYGNFSDPWGHPYQYLKIEGGSAPKGKWRKDRFLVPVNTDFDLYSMGPDGASVSPFTAKASHDDIVRANNGGFVGIASNY